MKRILFVFLMMTCSVSWAEWERIGKTDSYFSFVDRGTIRKKGNFVEMWNMKSFFEIQVDDDGTKYKSSKSLARYDCKNETRGLVSFVWYANANGSGDVVYSATKKSKNEINDEPIVPESAAEFLWEIACGKK